MNASNNSVYVIVNRGATVKLGDLPRCSMALDGYVQGPEVDLEGERISFDHHAGCVRSFTASTCKQVHDALLLGFAPADWNVYVNDVDGDTVLAVWLLKNPSRIEELLIKETVDAVNAVDVHGPAYPLGEALKKRADGFYQFVMRPESDHRRAKTYGTCDLGSLLKECLERMDSFADGFGMETREEKSRSYEITHEGNGWVMAKSNDFIFDLLYKDGHTAGVAYCEQPDGSIAYTVGKKSEFVDFPVGPADKPGTVLFILNGMEPGWGGGSTIGGAPRAKDGSRSKLSPDQVALVLHSIA